MTARLTKAERHAELVEHGWRTRVDGLLRSPDPRDLKAYTHAAAWELHTEHDQQPTDRASGRVGARDDTRAGSTR